MRRKLRAVALIGPDGAGKTTLTRMLAESGLLPFRYLYMGIAIPGSNVALPTSRFAERVKEWRARRQQGNGSARASASGAKAGVRPSRLLWAATRLANGVADAWYRQLVSWYYQLRGYAVLYDRHFVFDFAPEITASPAVSWDRRAYHWFLQRLYPRPDLVIFLDAPAEVLFARKGELSVPELERRRQAFLRMGARFPNFVRIDATRPLREVYDDVARQVVRFGGAERGTSQRPAAAAGAVGSPRG